jgi:hypothetical protein
LVLRAQSGDSLSSLDAAQAWVEVRPRLVFKNPATLRLLCITRVDGVLWRPGLNDEVMNMNDARDLHAESVGTLDALLVGGDSSARPYKVFIGHNLGHRVFLLSIPMHDFYAISDVANERGKNGEPIAQRKLDEAHARKLAVYMLKGLVASARARREIRKQPPLDALNAVSEALGPQPYLSLQPPSKTGRS